MEMDTRSRVGATQHQIAGGGDNDEKSFITEITEVLGVTLTEGELDLALECYRRRLPTSFSLHEIRKARGSSAFTSSAS